MDNLLTTKCILIVQNDSSFSHPLKNGFTEKGLYCDHAENTASALELLDKHYYDLVISDIVLPVMDGIQFMQMAKSKCAHIDFIMIMGQDSPYDAMEILEKGAADILTKPFDLDILWATIYKIDRSRQRVQELLTVIPQEYIDNLDLDQKDNSQDIPTLSVDTSNITNDDLNTNEKLKKVTTVCSQLSQRLTHEINIRKLNALVLQEAKDRLNAHLDNSPLAYIEWDLEFKVVSLNIAAEKLFGYNLCEIKGSHFFDTIASSSDDIKQTRMEKFMMENIAKDGSKRYCQWFNTPLTSSNNQILGIASLIENTSELFKVTKKLSDALKSNKNLFNKLKYEYNIASAILSKVMKQTTQEFSHVKFLRASMEVVCGDLSLAFNKPSGGLYAFIGDFTGHGLSAAIGAVPIVDLLIDMTNQNCSINDILFAMNQKIKDTMPTGKFLAASIMEYSYITGVLKLWNGGNPDIIIVGPEGIKKRFPSNNLPLGVLDSNSLDFTLEEFQTEPYDRVYAYSDGIIETFNEKEEIFGIERFEQVLTELKDPKQSIEEITQAIDTFRGDIEQQDDVTLIELTCIPGTDIEMKDISDDYHNFKGCNVKIKLDSTHLQSMNVSEYLIQIIEQNPLFLPHKESIFVILQELVSNSLDYGLLKLDPKMKKSLEGYEAFFTRRQKALDDLKNGWIHIELEVFPEPDAKKIIIQIEDSGNGFNFHKILTNLEDNVSFSGRGLSLIKSLCHEMHFYDNGNRIRVICKFDDND
ncbi:chemotaxis protein CheY [Candidatus Magnetomorum sp. HK-1]|nr:chemotaxis protein CheY [Candidatus Magnetomorum sp. HK-1]